ncbi:uncharacterized protein SCDLUD_001607 [Saccharomycodes ludwigii]|uniref:uncharacterized protein n=1 Tax=Saccharomycodes ludwigii TaxID=36035 RepID=UPI001E8B096F|nr:hypothetical protein SCDLUD_001607 [Saccharomycodes ludwigii]KAH3901824.1 hypothetical protein SCDLUD_001607 [Saccharomycodes ludwigii]
MPSPTTNKPLVSIKNALFAQSLILSKKKTPQYVFPKPINFTINSSKEKWCVWGPSKSKFLNILNGSNYLILPNPKVVQYNKPANINDHTPNNKFHIEYIKFKLPPTTPHLSARFEYFKDEFDQNLSTFVKDIGDTSTRVDYTLSKTDRQIDEAVYNEIMNKLELLDIQDRLVMALSNGQMRRARLARSLLHKPDLCLVDDLYLGLDPHGRSLISKVLNWYSEQAGNGGGCVVTGLRIQDEIPQWCTHIVCCDEVEGIVFQGEIGRLNSEIRDYKTRWLNSSNTRISGTGIGNKTKYTTDDLISTHEWYHEDGNLGKGHETFKMLNYELKDIDVAYRGVPVLKNIHWKIAKGSKWHIRGNNGCGKSTLLSLLTADHPQSWNSKIIVEGKPRKTGNSNYFDINKEISVSSPELHAVALKNREMSVLTCLLSGFNDDSSNNFLVKKASYTNNRMKLIDMYVDYFGVNVPDIESCKFQDLSVSDQKLILFIRCCLKMPKLMILDESFSGMEVDPMLRCHNFLKSWPGTVLVVSHIEEETPEVDHYIRLIKPGEYEIGDVSHD